MNLKRSEELLLLIEKKTDKLTEQSRTRPETLGLKLNRSRAIFSATNTPSELEEHW